VHSRPERLGSVSLWIRCSLKDLTLVFELAEPVSPQELEVIVATVCAWCESRMPVEGGTAHEPAAHEGEDGLGGVSHGICARCVADMGIIPIENLATFDRSRFDELPFGIIEVDRDGRVLTYNRWEEELAGRHREETLGKLFFSEVAPCTGVAEFEGRFRSMVARNESRREELDFVFRFPGEERLVNISLTWDPRWQRGFILVRASQ